MALPDFLCIGAQKAGTTWLYEQLRSHPEVWLPPVKELHYFDYLFVEESRRWAGSHLRTGVSDKISWHLKYAAEPNADYISYLTRLALDAPFTRSWYEAAFDWIEATGKVLGDVTPEYCTIGRDGVEFVKQMIPNAKIVYLVRDPVTRALSQLRMNMERHGPTAPDEVAWLECARDPVIKRRGAYSSYVPQWKAAYGDRILCIPYGRMLTEPLGVLRSIETFLSISSHQFSDIQKRIHETRKVEIPESVHAYLQNVLEPERAFLREHFGVEFASAT